MLVDGLLIFGALKRRPTHIVPWLCANSVLMGVLLVLVAFFLFFGYVRLALDYDEYVSVLSLIGCLAGGHFFACLVVFQVSWLATRPPRLLLHRSIDLSPF